MMQHLVSAVLWWLFTGAVLWALADPVRYADFVVYRYVQRHGRLPSATYQALATVVAIVLWPLILLAAIVGMVLGAVR